MCLHVWACSTSSRNYNFLWDQHRTPLMQAHPTMISHLSSYYTPVAKVVSAGIGILHSTWKGSGLHLPLLPHVALWYDGCWHWNNISEFTAVLLYASTVTPLARVGVPQFTLLTGEQRKSINSVTQTTKSNKGQFHLWHILYNYFNTLQICRLRCIIYNLIVVDQV